MKLSSRNRAPLIHLASQVFDTPLAILPEKLDTILRAVGPRLTVDQPALDQLLESGVLRQPPRAYYDDDDDDYGSSSSSSSSSKPYKLTNDGIAIIPVSGVLLKKGGWMSALSGCSSYASISSSLAAAMKDGAVRGVLFDINSPGGTTHGCFELADEIYSYRKKKPMYAVANDLAASAAYAIGSAADRLYVTRTGGVGSVGVFSLHVEQAKLDDTIGVKYTYIHYGAKKVAGNPHEPLSKSAHSDMQSEVDREGEIFVSIVARNRNLTAAKVRDTEAACYFAELAVSAGFADSVATFAEAERELVGNISNSGVTMLPTGTGAVTPTPAPVSESNMAQPAKPKSQIRAERRAEIATTSARLSALLAASDEPDGDEEEVDPDMCPECDGSGKVDGKECSACHGSGKAAKASADASVPAVPAPAAAPISTPTPAPDSPDSPVSTDPKGNVIPMPTEPVSSLSPVSALSAYHKEVAELCKIAGCPEKAADYVLAETQVPLDQVRKELLDLRAKKSAEASVNPNNLGVKVDQLQAAVESANKLAAESNGTIKPSDALLRVMRANPSVYEDVEDHRGRAISNAHSSKERRQYCISIAPALRALGLSTSATFLENKL